MCLLRKSCEGCTGVLSLQLLERPGISLVVRAGLTLNLLRYLRIWIFVSSPGCLANFSLRGPMRTESLAAVRTEVSQANHLNCH